MAKPGENEPSAEKTGIVRQSQPERRIMVYALLSLGCFLAALLLLAILLTNTRTLVEYGFGGSFYYLVLVPFGLCVAGFLFGALRSQAYYRGKHAGGLLELGGPIVGFVLVVFGGIWFAPPLGNFSVTVFVHGPRGRQDLVLRGAGFVVLDLGGQRRQERIGDLGQAVFPEIAGSFRGKEVVAAIEAPDYDRADDRPVRLDGSSVYLEVRHKPERITGTVVDPDGHLLSGASVTLAGLETKTDRYGRFALQLPQDRPRDPLILRISANGYQVSTQEVLPNGGDVGVAMQR
jgi:hypothetical protein